MLKTGIQFSKQGYEISDADLLRLYADVGFSSFFTGWVSEGDFNDRTADVAAKCGLVWESIHAPFGGITDIWKEGEKGELWVAKLKAVADTCVQYGIPYMTVHTMNAPRYNNNGPCGSRFNQLGADRFAEVVSYCGERNVKASFENVEFPQREMESLIKELEKRGLENGMAVTYDVGHWHCYPCELDFADAFGKYLIGTHVHDNFGLKDPQIITWDDDSHLLPFDGTLDYRKVGDTLRRCDYRGTITLEISRDRVGMPWYKDYTVEQYFATAAERAAHVARLCE